MATHHSNYLKNKFSKVSNLDLTANVSAQINALQEVLTTERGYKLQDKQEIITEIIYLSSSKDVRIKKLVYLYLTLIVECDPDVFLHITNSASHDLADPNPIVRSSTLRAITELPLLSDVTLEFIASAINDGLQDNSSNVRCIAINGIIQMNTNKELKKEMSEILTSMMDRVKRIVQSDSDPSVVVRCVECLALENNDEDELLQQSILSLVDRITLLEPSQILSVIYHAKGSLNFNKLNEEVIIKILNKLEVLRSLSIHPSIPIEVFSLMHKLSSHVTYLQKDVSIQIVLSLLLLLQSVSNLDLKFLILCNLLAFSNDSCVTDRFVNEYKCFLLLSEDRDYVKVKKLLLLRCCITSETAIDIYNNIRHYLHSAKAPTVLKTAFTTFETLYEVIPDKCNKALHCALHSKQCLVVECAVTTLYSITVQKKLKNNNWMLPKQFSNSLLTSYSTLRSCNSRSCFLSLINATEDKLDIISVAKIFDSEILLFQDNSSSNHLHYLLISVIHFFVQCPRIFHRHLKELLLKIRDSNEHYRLVEQAKLYIALLKENVFVNIMTNCSKTSDLNLCSELKTVRKNDFCLNSLEALFAS